MQNLLAILCQYSDSDPQGPVAFFGVELNIKAQRNMKEKC